MRRIGLRGDGILDVPFVKKKDKLTSIRIIRLTLHILGYDLQALEEIWTRNWHDKIDRHILCL